jgi:uncharacterized membrane protein
VKLSYLVRGLPGHPLHPPLTDVTVGLYTGASVSAILAALGVSEENLVTAWWLALVGGLIVTVPTALTGLLEWLTISRGTQLWRTATLHLTAMVSATVFFLIAAVVGHGSYVDRTVDAGPIVLTLIGFGLLTLGGWLGGAIVFTYGMRVLR